MRLLPTTVLNPNTPDGERYVRSLLAAAPASPGAFVAHSVNLPEHAYKRYGEADFVLVDRRGLLVIEVKGGIVRHSGGVWSFENGRGQARRRSEGPHRQAESGMQALLRTLARAGAPPIGIFGWVVVTPFTFWAAPHPEIPVPLLLDRSACTSPFSFTEALDGAFQWWRDRAVASGRATHPLDSAALERHLLPEFQYAPAPARCAEAIEEDVVRLTERQAEILEGLSGNARLLVEGGAGTGKTLLAAASARQAAASGSSVGLIVAAPVLAAHLAAAMPRVTVADPATMRYLPARSLDVLVVDEGQELANPEGLHQAGRLLREGLDAGCWRWFMDPANQALHSTIEQGSLARLRAMSACYRLTRNVRSTRNIVNLVRGTVGADVGISDIDPRGVLPHIEHVLGPAAAALEAAVRRAREWIDTGVAPGDIAILAAEQDVTSLLELARRNLGDDVALLAAPAALDAARTRAVVSDPSTFRGMERAWVAVACTPGFAEQPRSERFLYVAMTRPRAGLAVFLADGADAWFRGLQAEQESRAQETTQ
ncbi:nuclease-related domain-containing protein [Teichococcus oryzae]|uniref:NERD domain-containing protein n=1 Tax=Teichococcus oryzae TaxID=1608942 RepID=A0A5B2TG99_9PROT|nr:nuclease-related domain-containing protein [Pseudoroseomonas oryzae]KAA2213199.1 NERD domain-containing protein [Pseudoroseomonas oryzae]